MAKVAEVNKEANEHGHALVESIKAAQWGRLKLELAEELVVLMRDTAEAQAHTIHERRAREERPACAVCERPLDRPSVGQITMMDEVTNLPRGYQACSVGCYQKLEVMERERRLKRLVTE